MAVGFVVWALAFVGGFAVMGAVAGSSRERRPHFWLRAGLISSVPALLPVSLLGAQSLGILPPGTSHAIGPILAFTCVLTLTVTPVLLYQRPGTSPGESDGGGGGRGPKPRPTPPDPPSGGIPLPDADQSSVRLRAHDSPRRSWRRQRRTTREPRRPPTPTRPR